jgi:hypothetical protein
MLSMQHTPMNRRPWLAAAAVTVAGLLVRLPYLTQIPRFTDETVEALWAWSIVSDGALPLTHQAPYLGVVYPYLLALLFKLLGPSIWLPRAMTAVAGALTAGGTYLVGRRVTTEWAALLAGLLFATSAAPVFLNAHIAYSNSLTPLFVLLGTGLLVEAWHSGRGGLLVASGFSWALALQTHPTVLACLPGAALAALAIPNRPKWRWYGAAALAFLVGYGNMIAYNLLSAGATWQTVQNRPDYFAEPVTPTLYLSRLVDELARLAAMILGRPDLDWSAALGLMVALITGSLVLWAVWTTRRDARWPLAITLFSGLMLFPMFNERFTYPSGARYLCAFLPSVYILISAALADAWRRVHAHRFKRPVRQLCVVTASLLLLLPLVWLTQSYREAVRRGQTNASILALAAAVAQQASTEVVALDPALDVRKAEGGGDQGLVLDFLLTMLRVPHAFTETHELARALERGQWPPAVLLPETYGPLADDCYPRLTRLLALAPSAEARFDKHSDNRVSAVLIPAARVPMAHAETQHFDGIGNLLGYSFTPAVARPGETVFITLYWQADSLAAQPLHSFIHVIGADGRTVAQTDGPLPSPSATGGDAGPPGPTIEDRRPLKLPYELSAGPYRVHLGLYDPATGTRIGVQDAAGHWWPEAAVVAKTPLLIQH